jgi:hypothetical protein
MLRPGFSAYAMNCITKCGFLRSFQKGSGCLLALLTRWQASSGLFWQITGRAHGAWILFESAAFKQGFMGIARKRLRNVGKHKCPICP